VACTQKSRNIDEWRVRKLVNTLHTERYVGLQGFAS
jgi:hypothetical protein